ncbi:MAG: ATP-binding cassette domain-containing protein [Epsilonproteobacteria bacterium]|nr:ATP-binding cassette domain-containing protein [Campylobacterota bacterium]
MQYLTIKNLHFQYPNAALPLFENLNVEFETGWSCIIGANGSGKSTLLKLIAKEIQNENMMIKGNDFTYYCTQSTEQPPKDFEDFIYTFSSMAFKIKDLLNIQDSWPGQWQTLSHGERKRAQLAVALFKEPDVLLVDEPTNHLDAKNKKIVIHALKSFKGIGILVSHDRALLDTLSQTTMIIKNQAVVSFKTSFTHAMQAYQQDIAFLEKTKRQQNSQLQKLERSIQSQREKVSRSKKRLSKKSVDKNDSDRRNKINLAKLTGKDKSNGKIITKLQSQQKLLLSQDIKVDKTYKTGITFNAANASNIFPIVIEKGVLALAERKKLSYPKLTIDQYDKIGIIGDNGSGKSSFLTHVIATLECKEDYLYISQEISERENKSFFYEINKLPNALKGEIYTIIRKLASDPKKLQDSALPSPGEIRKLMIAYGLLQNPSLIILDEPTNHMDLDSILALELALKEYNGTMIVISHDRVFLEGLVTKVWEFIKMSEGSYQLIE